MKHPQQNTARELNLPEILRILIVNMVKKITQWFVTSQLSKLKSIKTRGSKKERGPKLIIKGNIFTQLVIITAID